MCKGVLFIAVFFLCAWVQAQTDSTYTPVGDYVDLTGTEIEIKPQPDRPRVTIIPNRIKPEFDTVDLEKSFIPELVGKGERIELLENSDAERSGLTQAIDLNSTLTKPRQQ